MKRSELEKIIEEEIYKYLDEKSVPQPYDRKSARKMSKAQIDKRKETGDKMMENPKTVAKFKKKFKADWKDHLWAAASNIALGGGFKQSNDSSDEE
jgi:hypothetical protein